MPRVILIAAIALFSVLGMLTAEFAVAADAPSGAGPTDNVVGGKPMKGEVTKTLKGRVWSQWADNPDGELLFGIQYWNSGEPGSGTPNGRSSSDLDVKPPDPLFSCCAWGFVGGADKNSPYSGWYHAATTVRSGSEGQGPHGPDHQGLPGTRGHGSEPGWSDDHRI